MFRNVERNVKFSLRVALVGIWKHAEIYEIREFINDWKLSGLFVENLPKFVNFILDGNYAFYGNYSKFRYIAFLNSN